MYIGIDLGTSSLKGILIDNGAVLRQATASYPISYPQSGWTEQDPNDWFEALTKVLSELTDGVKQDVKGISFGGQMHGLVALDKHDNVIRPCILWNDGRTEEQTKYLNETVGKQFLVAHTGNIAFAGFTAPKLLWLRANEPDNFAKISKIMLPKDYLVYKLTAQHVTDFSDASGTLLLDVKNKRWSQEMCDICSVKKQWLPQLCESYQAVGKVLPQFGLPNCVATVGAGDNAAAAIGTGTVSNGSCNISIGTSGTVFVACDNFATDSDNALHCFAHSNGKWHLLGCILSAASANKWWIEDILHTDYTTDVDDLAHGSNGVYFLPYLAGERCPHNDVNARGCFVGLHTQTTRRELSLAVIEGVTFALRDCLELARDGGLTIGRTTLCGGGAKSKLWRQIAANILNADICMTDTEQGPSYGAAILAAVGVGEYKSVQHACNELVHFRQVAVPQPFAVDYYNKRYEVYRRLYPALKQSFELMNTIH